MLGNSKIVQHLKTHQDKSSSLHVPPQALSHLDQTIAQKFEEKEDFSYREPHYECPICQEVFLVSKMYTMDCLKSHRFCFEDVRRYVEGRLKCFELPTCPMCLDVPYEMSETEIRQLFGQGAVLNNFYEVELRSALAVSNDVVPCPTPDCPQFLALDFRCGCHSVTLFILLTI